VSSSGMLGERKRGGVGICWLYCVVGAFWKCWVRESANEERES
jgi:hypothetical protein